MTTFIYQATTIALMLLSVTIKAQPSVHEMVKEWERAKAYTKEYLDIMPDSSYGLKPASEMRSFAEQMLHLTDANYRFAAAVSGIMSPVSPGSCEKTVDKSKANVTKIVLEGYDHVINSLKRLSSDDLRQTITFFDRQVTKEMVLMKLFEHQTHHRGQTTVYLRLAGVTPPRERLFD